LLVPGAVAIEFVPERVEAFSGGEFVIFATVKYSLVDWFVLLPCATSEPELVPVFDFCSWSSDLVELVDFSDCPAATSVELVELLWFVELRPAVPGLRPFASVLVPLVAVEAEASSGTGKDGTVGTIKPRVGFPC